MMELGHGTSVFHRRRLLSAGVIGVSAVGVSAWVVANPDQPSWTNAQGQLRFATGNPGGVFDTYGRALGAEVVRVMPATSTGTVATGGSFGNVNALLANRAEVAFCLGDSARLALAGAPPFDTAADLNAVARLYDSFLQVLVRADSAVSGLAALAGRRLAAGERDSGTRVVMTRCLEASGVDPRDVEFVELPLSEATAALEQGRIDALGFVSGVPVPALMDLAERIRLRALDLGDIVPGLVSRWGPQYVAGPLPAGPYRLPAAVETVSVTTYLLAKPDLDDELAFGLTSVLFDQQPGIARRVPDVRQPTEAAAIFTQPVPLHPGALRYYRDRRGG